MAEAAQGPPEACPHAFVIYAALDLQDGSFGGDVAISDPDLGRDRFLSFLVGGLWLHDVATRSDSGGS